MKSLKTFIKNEYVKFYQEQVNSYFFIDDKNFTKMKENYDRQVFIEHFLLKIVSHNKMLITLFLKISKP